MEKVTYKGVQSATVRTDNSVDPERAYDIAASVNINGTAVGSVDGGDNNGIAGGAGLAGISFNHE